MALRDYEAEWSPRQLSEPIRQGDIFRWRQEEGNDAWRQYGIVITADCDMAQEKHRGILSFCPILTIVDFLQLFWLPDELRRQYSILLRGTAEFIGRLQVDYRTRFPQPIDESLIPAWLARRGAAGIADDLSLPQGRDRDTLLERLSALEAIEVSIESPVAEQLRVLATAKLGCWPGVPDQVHAQQTRVWKDLRARVRRLPGDLFFLNELGEGLTGGFVVQLRRISEIAQCDIAIDPLRERSDAGIRAVRVSRLGVPFRYRLTQQLAAVFADIGLPRQYERACDATMNHVGSILGLREI